MILARDHGNVPRKPQVPYLAIADALRDPKLLADAARLKMSINYVPGEKIEQLVRRIAATPKSVIEKVKAATR